HVTLDLEALRVHEHAVLVDVERAGARVEVAGQAVNRALHREEAVAREREVRRDTRGRERALREELLNVADLDARARERRRSAGEDRVTEDVLEDDALGLEARRVDVGDVVADDADGFAFGAKT